MGMGGSAMKTWHEQPIHQSLWGIPSPIVEKPPLKTLPTAPSSSEQTYVGLQYFLTACLVATTAVSVWLVRTDMYGGRTAAHVWWYGWVTA